MVWQRPATAKYPKVWANFEVEKTKQSFVIKDLTPDYYDIALGYMTNIFLQESAIAGPLRILYDPIGRKQMQEKWLKILKSNMSLVCVTMDDIPRVAAIHLTLVKERKPREIVCNVSDPNILGQFSKFSKVVEDLKNDGDLYEMFGADFYLSSLGLLVLPEFRGIGIATEILKARLVMCHELSLPGTATVFSTPGAQAAAKKAGYNIIAIKRPQDCSYFELKHTIAVMGVKIDQI